MPAVLGRVFEIPMNLKEILMKKLHTFLFTYSFVG